MVVFLINITMPIMEGREFTDLLAQDWVRGDGTP